MIKNKNTDLALLILRISIGGLILFHGVAKLIDGIDFIKDLVGPFAYGVYLGEVVAPILILIGYRTRLASAVLLFTMLTAILTAHPGDIFKLNEFGGWALELIGLFALGAAALFFSGAGKYAVSTGNRWD